MLSRILVPTDGSELSKKAVLGAVEAAKKLHAKLIGLTVTVPYPFTTGQSMSSIRGHDNYDQRMREEAQERLAPLQAAAAEAGVELETVVQSATSPYEAIIGTAK